MISPNQVLFVAPRPSNGGRMLAQSLGCRYTSRYGVVAKRDTKLIVCWGGGMAYAQEATGYVPALNKYNVRASNKKNMLYMLRDRSYNLDYVVEPFAGMFDDGSTWFQRTIVSGHSGAGIRVCRSESDIDISAPTLMTKYFPKTHEFRFHMFDGRCIDVVQKKKRNGVVTDGLIRNHDNGWVFAHSGIALREEDKASIIARLADVMSTLSLDFGAADVLCILGADGSLVDWKLCEINTAPGLESTVTIEAYKAAFRERFNNAG